LPVRSLGARNGDRPRLRGVPRLTMATDLPDLRPAIAFELSNEPSHFHEDNLKTGCDT
jgi:hypothetical protein